MKNKRDRLFFTQLFVPQASQSSYDRRTELEVLFAIPSAQSACGMEIIMKQFSYMLHTIFHYAPGESVAYLAVEILSCLISFLQLILLQSVVDSFLQNSLGSGIWQGVLFLGIYFLFQVLIQNGKERLQFGLEKKVTLALGTHIAETVHSLDYPHFESETMYDLVEKISDKPYEHFWKAFYSFSKVIGILLQLIAVFGYLLYLSGGGVGVSVVLIVLIFYFDYKIMVTSDALENERIPEERRMKYYLNLFYDKKYLYEIKIMQTKNFFMKRIEQHMDKVYKKRLEISLHTQKYYGISCLFLSLWTIWIFAFTGLQVYQGALSAGVFLACVKMIDMVSGLSGDFSEEYVECGEEVQKLGYLKRLEGLQHGENVSFSYDGKEVFRNLNVRIPSDRHVALVGENGAGKSTFIKLLLGLYEPKQGSILVDGRSVKDRTPKERKRLFAAAFQDFYRYPLSVKENLSMCQNGEKTTADYIAALEMVGLEALKDKLDYKIGKYGENSTDLSDGQWQKIALARVLLSDAKTFLLDEPTASMDPIGESKLYEDMMNVMKDRGVIIVTHRLALAKTVDLIAVMRDGGIVGLGSHEELMENNAYYRQLYDAQSEWYR